MVFLNWKLRYVLFFLEPRKKLLYITSILLQNHLAWVSVDLVNSDSEGYVTVDPKSPIFM